MEYGDIILGNLYMDQISEYVGVATARAEYLDGDTSIQLTRQGHVTPEGKVATSWFDPSRLMPVI